MGRGRFPGGENGSPRQYSWRVYPMNRGALADKAYCQMSARKQNEVIPSDAFRWH